MVSAGDSGKTNNSSMIGDLMNQRCLWPRSSRNSVYAGSCCVQSLKDTVGMACKLYIAPYNDWTPKSSFKTTPKGMAKTDAIILHRYQLLGKSF